MTQPRESGVTNCEKHLAGSTGGDLSGVKQDMLGALLTWMQDRKSSGIIFLGVPGSGKSAMAKAAGNYAQVPTISFDLAGMQESLVGKSGQNIRNALKVVDAVSSGKALIIATCNSIQSLPPELRRRFTLGTFFFDLPNRYGRQKIWDLYINNFDLKKKQDLPVDVGWTGAEIEKCCTIAWGLSNDKEECTLRDAASFIVPIAKSNPEGLVYLRKMADGTFISASDGGVYQMPEDEQAPQQAKRQISLS